MNYQHTSSPNGGWGPNPYYNKPTTGYMQQRSSLVGLRNLGNTCYMSSVLQALFDVLDFSDRTITQHQPITYLYTKLQQSHN